MKEGDERTNHSAEPGADSLLTHRCVDKHSIHENNSDTVATTVAARIPVQSFDSAYSDDGLLRVFLKTKVHFLYSPYLYTEFYFYEIIS